MTPESSSGSIKRSITIASVIMMASVFLSRVLGIVREMVLASYGGTRTEMDAYVAAFFLPEIVNHPRSEQLPKCHFSERRVFSRQRQFLRPELP